MPNLYNLEAEMKRRGIDASDIADAADRTVRTVQNWLAGRSSPSAKQAILVKERCFPGESVEHLFSRAPAPAGNQQNKQACSEAGKPQCKQASKHAS